MALDASIRLKGLLMEGERLQSKELFSRKELSVPGDLIRETGY